MCTETSGGSTVPVGASTAAASVGGGTPCRRADLLTFGAIRRCFASSASGASAGRASGAICLCGFCGLGWRTVLLMQLEIEKFLNNQWLCIGPMQCVTADRTLALARRARSSAPAVFDNAPLAFPAHQEL